MARTKLNCWQVRECGREPGGARAQELGLCPATTDVTCDGINSGENAGRFCWAVAGTLCGETAPERGEAEHACPACSFFRQVKYEEGCQFQLLKPGLGLTDPGDLHRLVNNLVAFISISRDIFACLAIRPLLTRITQHAVSITGAAAASVYLLGDSDRTLVTEARTGSVVRPDRVGVDEETPAAEAARTRSLCKGTVAQPGHPEPTTVAAIPIGGGNGSVGVLELLKEEPFSPDDEWFLRQLALIAGLGISNARLIAEQRELKEIDKVKSKFVALLMHQIGSPLATVSCCLQALRRARERLSEADRDELTQCGLDRVESVQALARKLLDLAAMRRGSSFADTRPVAPAASLRQEVEDRRPDAREKGVGLAVHDESNGALVQADPAGLRIIFGNLLDNGIKYSNGPGKNVEVNVSADADRVRVQVRDQGLGIPASEQSRIFEELHRASNAAGSGVVGSGLGLAVVKELVERYGGAIQLESELGVGTCFSVEFPTARVGALSNHDG